MRGYLVDQIESICTFSDIKRIAKDPAERVRFIRRYEKSFRFWGAFTVIGVLLYLIFSDGDFSFLLTVASAINTMSFLMVLVKVEELKSCEGVSLRMIECYFICFTARLLAIIPFEGYLPFDRTGDYIYRACELASWILSGRVAYLCRSKYAETYDSSADTLAPLLLIVPCLVLALILHPSLNNFAPADITWVFALYLESLTVLPQLMMFQKQGKVQSYITHFLAGHAVAKVLAFIFWVTSYRELADHVDHSVRSYVGVWVVVMQLVQMCVMGDFIYKYVACLRKGIGLHFIIDV